MRVLYLIRGAPGSGKSTMATGLVRAGLADHMLEADQYFMKDGKYVFEPERIRDAHKYCQSWCEAYCALGKGVVISNTMTKTKDAAPYYDIANRYGYKVQEVILRHRIADNQHNVPEEVVQRYEKQLMESIGGALF